MSDLVRLCRTYASAVDDTLEDPSDPQLIDRGWLSIVGDLLEKAGAEIDRLAPFEEMVDGVRGFAECLGNGDYVREPGRFQEALHFVLWGVITHIVGEREVNYEIP